MDFNINDSNNYQLVYEDQKHVHGLRRMVSDSNLDIAFARGYVTEVDNGAYHNKLSRYQCEHGGIRQEPSAFSIQLSSRFPDGCDQVSSGIKYSSFMPTFWGVEYCSNNNSGAFCNQTSRIPLKSIMQMSSAMQPSAMRSILSNLQRHSSPCFNYKATTEKLKRT